MATIKEFEKMTYKQQCEQMDKDWDSYIKLFTVYAWVAGSWAVLMIIWILIVLILGVKS